MEEIKNIEELVTKGNTGTLINRIRESKEEIDRVKGLIKYIDSDEFRGNDYEINEYCRMFAGRYHDYLKDKIELMEKLHHKMTNKELGLTSVTTTAKKQAKPKKQVADYTSSDDVDMLI